MEPLKSLLPDLFIGGLHRAASLSAQKILRINRIDKALKGDALESTASSIAVSDFYEVANLYYTKFNKKADLFFKELEKSGIIELMVENALIGKDSPKVRNHFLNLHNNFIKGDSNIENGELLYERLMKSFSVTVKEISKDKIIFELIRHSNKEIAQRLTSIEEKMEVNINMPAIEFTYIQPTLLKLAKNLQTYYKYLKVETNKGPQKVDINKIYISPKLAIRSGARIQDLTLMRDLGSLASLKKERPELNSGGYYEVSKFTFNDIAESFRNVVVLGDPGGGKSTFCQKLCYEMARKSALLLQYDSQHLNNEQYVKFPIRIVLRKFEQARSENSQLDLLTYIVRKFVNFSSDTEENVRPAILYLLRNGRAFLAFDGLDEILETSKRQEFVDLVRAFCDCHPLCPVLVTSRLVGYDSAKLPEAFEEIILEKFDENEIKKYITNFMSVIGGLSNEEANKKSVKFIEQTKLNASDLRKNPLMLGLMGSLFLRNGDVPSNRPEIYKKCAELMFEKWDQARGINADLTTDFDRLQIFTSLAEKMYGNPDLAAGVPNSWLEKFIKFEFEIIYSDKTKAYQEVRKFLNFITGRAWLLTEVGDELYGFTHQTFLEYFFARSLEGKFDTVKDLLNHIKKRILKQEWNEVNHLAIQLKIDNNRRKTEETAQFFKAAIKSAKHNKHKILMMNFFANCFEYLAPTEATTEEIIDLMKDEAFTLHKLLQPFALQFFSIITNTAKDRKNFIETKIGNVLSSELFSNNRKDSEIAAFILGGDFLRSGTKTGNGRIFKSLPAEMRISIRTSVRSEVIKLATAHDFYLNLAWTWYGLIPDSVFFDKKICMIFNNPIGKYSDLVDGLSCLVLESSNSLQKKDVFSSERSKYFRSILSDIAVEFEKGTKLDIEQFNKRLMKVRIPALYWKDVYKNLNDNDNALRGAIIIRHVIYNLFTLKNEKISRTKSYQNEFALLSRDEVKYIRNSTSDGKIISFYDNLYSGKSSLFTTKN